VVKKKQNAKVAKKGPTTDTHQLDEEDTENQSIVSNTDQPDNVIYDANSQSFFTARFNNSLKRYVDKTLVQDTSTIDPDLLKDAKNTPNTWVSLPLGDACDDIPPMQLLTTVKCLYEQFDDPYCVTYCMANALFYCGFDQEARALAAQAPLIAPLAMNKQLQCLRGFLPNLVPSIGLPTVYGKRCTGNNKKKRSITWRDLFSVQTPYPTLVVPAKEHTGRMTHAFCVVDDLIFDSSTSHALQLRMESINWIFQHKEVDIFVALRFNQKVSPKGHKVRWTYTRQMKRNWIPEKDIMSEKNDQLTN